MLVIFFFFNDTATTEIYTLSLHDALPISVLGDGSEVFVALADAIDVRQECRRLSGELTRLERSEEHTSELQSQSNLVCRLLLEKKKTVWWGCALAPALAGAGILHLDGRIP